MTWSSRLLGVLLFLLAVVPSPGCGDDDDDDAAGLCDASGLSEALSAASSGDVVEVGACTISGNFVVPAGVELRGQGSETSGIQSDADATVTLEAGAGTTRLADLAITSAGTAGVLTQGTGDGTIALSGLRVEATLGIGVGIENVASLSVDGVEIGGPVDASNADSFTPPWEPSSVATVGLGVFGVDEVGITSSNVSGFASVGAIVVASGLEWTTGGVRENLGSGLLISGGTATLTNVEIHDTLSGAGLYPAYGGVFSGGAIVTSSGLVIDGTEGHGLLHDNVDADHVDLSSSGNERTGVWAQNAGSFRLTGAASMLMGNGQAGLMIAAVDDVEIRDAHISDTVLAPTVPDGDVTPVDMGDGLQIRDSVGTVVLADLAVANNGRAGILIDLGGGSAAGYELEGVSVDGTGEELGCIGQNGDFPDGWAASVERLGATAVNDEAVVDPLGVTGIIQPEDLPATNLADLSSLLD